eukprot:scaffold199459_cov30-Tisochrysis_lutea.AAC.1
MVDRRAAAALDAGDCGIFYPASRCSTSDTMAGGACACLRPTRSMRSLAILHALYLFSSACALRIGGGNPCASWPCLLDHLRRHTLVCVLAAGLAVHPLAPHAYAEVTSGVLRSQGAGIEVVRSGSIGSPVAGEVWALIDKYFLDRTFNGVDLKAEQIRLESLAPLTDEKALEESATLVRRLGDRYSRVLTPTQAIKLGKYDVTGVGLNLIISDSGMPASMC